MTSVEMMWIGCGMIRGSLLGGRAGICSRFPPFCHSSDLFLLIVLTCRPMRRLSDVAHLHIAVACSAIRAADARWIILIPIWGFPVGFTFSGT